jgi:hypothetical protein
VRNNFARLLRALAAVPYADIDTARIGSFGAVARFSIAKPRFVRTDITVVAAPFGALVFTVASWIAHRTGGVVKRVDAFGPFISTPDDTQRS